MQLPAFITERLYRRVFATMRSRPSDTNIGKDARGQPYLQRWFAIPRNRFFNIYLHLYHHDDAAELHSHPWWSVSLCVNGELREYHTRDKHDANVPSRFKLRSVRKGDIVWRSPDMFHRLDVVGVRTITIFITGPKIKTWYFACKRGLIEWKNYVSGHDPYGRVTNGCGEADAYSK